MIRLSLSKAWCFLLGALCSYEIGQAQTIYFSNLYDYNQTGDGGTHVFIRPDSSYVFMGSAFDNNTGKYGTCSFLISKDGNTVLRKSIVASGDATYLTGFYGVAKRYGTGYVSPFTASRRQGQAATGIVIYNSDGDTVLTRLLTDTNSYVEDTWELAILPDSSFIAVGERDSLGKKASWAFVRHIGKNGDLLWTRTFNRDTTANNRFTSIHVLSGGRLLVGGNLHKRATIGLYSFHFDHPWMLLMDSNANILKETIYSDHYYPGSFVGGGMVRPDVNGGYFHWGSKDSTPMPYPQSVQSMGNFPDYLAHLDEDFNMKWRVSFSFRGPTNYEGGIGRIWQAIQTRDYGYLVMGSLNGVHAKAWLVKLNRYGKIQWEHTYYKDSSSNGYLADVEERPEGGYVAVGFTQPCKTCRQDFWLLSVDSNGCEKPGCSITTAVPKESIAATLSIYPNPITDAFTVDAPKEGNLTIYNSQGKVMTSFHIQSGKQRFNFPTPWPSGLFIGRYTSRDGLINQSVRLLYQP